jgi:cyanophycinase
VRTFLIGGGRDAVAVHTAFVRAAAGPVVAFVLDEGPDTDVARWSATLTEAGADEQRIVVVSPQRPPVVEDLDEMTGIYVAGGLTPGYRDVLVDAGTGWLDAARAANMVYAGFSAGATIAARHALIGGWRTVLRGHELAVCDEDVAEDLDALTVLPGLGLVDVMIEAHAAQWGTLNRLVHALLSSPAVEGWAIDENTAVEIDGGGVSVHGSGAATRVRRQGERLDLTVHIGGDQA